MTTILDEWAAQWRVPLEAVHDLRRRLQPDAPTQAPAPPLSEAAVSQQVRLEAGKRGMLLFRNNVGGYEAEGRWIRYGLLNDSAALNARYKSSDFIGIDPVVITQAHVGHTIGQFVAPEIKHATWRWSGTEREIAQRNFHDLVVSKGGRAGFVTAAGGLC